MSWVDGIRGLLIDADGTLLDGDSAIPGAADAVARVEAAGLPFRVTTNTTRRPRATVAEVLRRAGIAVGVERVLAPSRLARRLVLESGRTRASLLVPAASKEDFAGVVEDEEHPDWVVVGDLARGFTFDVLNGAFLRLRAGAELLALQKNRYWLAGAEGPMLDAGAFVAALEYAAAIRARVVGKPSREFFDLAIAELGLPARDVLVVGDDLENDCVGGAAAGCRTALVRTGKHAGRAGGLPAATPDLLLDSVADLVPR